MTRKLNLNCQKCCTKRKPFEKDCEGTDTTNKEIDASTSMSFEITRIDTNESSYQDIVSLLPEAIQTLKENGRETEYVSFNRLLAEFFFSNG